MKKKQVVGRIDQIIENLTAAKEPLIFIKECYEGGATLKTPDMAVETFSIMAGKALDELEETLNMLSK